LAGELAPHFGDSGSNLVARVEKRRVELLAEGKLDLERLKLLLDRGARFRFGPRLLRRNFRRLGRALLSIRRGMATPTKAMSPPRAAKGRNGRPGTTPSTAIVMTARKSAFG
jgi:hypothetical protein